VVTERSKRKTEKMDNQEASKSSVGRSGAVDALLVTMLLSVVFYFARVVLEPIAFAFFGIALILPLQRALEARMPNAFALLLTVLVTLVGFFMLVSAIALSIGDVVHWILANLSRFQSLYARVTQGLETHGIFVTEWAGQYDVRTFAGLLQQIAMAVNSFIGFCAVVFLLLTFGLTELTYYKKRFDELEPMLGWKMSQVGEEIGRKIRKYMLIRTSLVSRLGWRSLFIRFPLVLIWRSRGVSYRLC
jgi:predicted PurR-regulated permease PerM